MSKKEEKRYADNNASAQKMLDKLKLSKIEDIEKKLKVDIETFYDAMIEPHDEFEYEYEGNKYLLVTNHYIGYEGELVTGVTLYKSVGKVMHKTPVLKKEIELDDWQEYFHSGSYAFTIFDMEKAKKEIEEIVKMRAILMKHQEEEK